MYNQSKTVFVRVARQHPPYSHELTLSPRRPNCGICQERLFHWGQDVEVAVPAVDAAATWDVKTLKEVQPFYWVNAFKNNV